MYAFCHLIFLQLHCFGQEICFDLFTDKTKMASSAVQATLPQLLWKKVLKSFQIF